MVFEREPLFDGDTCTHCDALSLPSATHNQTISGYEQNFREERKHEFCVLFPAMRIESLNTHNTLPPHTRVARQGFH